MGGSITDGGGLAATCALRLDHLWLKLWMAPCVFVEMVTAHEAFVTEGARKPLLSCTHTHPHMVSKLSNITLNTTLTYDQQLNASRNIAVDMFLPIRKKIFSQQIS